MVQILSDAANAQPSSDRAPSSPDGGASTGEHEVLALIDALGRSWAEADETAMAACFTEDADYTTFDGTRFHSKKAIAAVHAELFRTVLKGSRLVGVEPVVRFLSADVAVVRGAGAVVGRKQKAPRRGALSVHTTVVVKREGRWQIAAFQNTRYRPWTETFVGRVLSWFMPVKTRPEPQTFPLAPT